MNRPSRRFASLILSATARLLAPNLSSWSRAMERELAEIPDDAAALVFAAGCLRATLTLAMAGWFHALSAAAFRILSPSTSSTRSLSMNLLSARPRLLGLICGAGAVASGVAYMLMAGAPTRFVFVNLAALALGTVAWLALRSTAATRFIGTGSVVLALAMTILATALFGVAADGASRWVSVGPLGLQVSLIVLPLMIVLYARRADAIGMVGMIIAALALALQPDRAMAGVLLAGLLATMVATRSRYVVLPTAAATLAFGWTLLKPDTLPASPYVDRVFYTAFDVHPLAGMAVVIGALALLLPAVIGAWRGASDRPALLAFGGCWLGVVVAAALDNYPTPLVGYGGSAVLGYLLSAALLPNLGQSSRGRTLDPEQVSGSASSRTSELRIAGLA